MLKDHNRPLGNLQILRIEFDHRREIVTIIYRVDKTHYAQYFSFLVWDKHNCFSANDLTNLIIKYKPKS